jgi:hypothetical protein
VLGPPPPPPPPPPGPPVPGGGPPGPMQTTPRWLVVTATPARPLWHACTDAGLVQAHLARVCGVWCLPASPPRCACTSTLREAIDPAIHAAALAMTKGEGNIHGQARPV